MPNKEITIFKNPLEREGIRLWSLSIFPLLKMLKEKSCIRGGMKGWNLVSEAGVIFAMQ